MNGRAGAPRITVVTPCLNSASFIGEAIDSVMEQRYPNFEHIVADGGSTDGTLEVLARYSHLRILPGPDGGVYSALNKALSATNGEIVGILNADDRYAPGAFMTALACFSQGDVVALAGDAISFCDASNTGEIEVARFTGVADDLLYHATLGNPCMNAWFFRTALFAQIGVFDPSYRVAGDREFMLRLACSGSRYRRVPRVFYRYRIHPGSMTFGGNPEIWETIVSEHNRMTAEYLRKGTLSKRARSLVTRSRTRETLQMAIRCARDRRWGRAAFYAGAGMRFDAMWPLRFAAHIFSVLGARLFLLA